MNTARRKQPWKLDAACDRECDKFWLTYENAIAIEEHNQHPDFEKFMRAMP